MNIVVDMTGGSIDLCTDKGTVLQSCDPEQAVDLADELATAILALASLARQRRRRFTRLARALRRL